MNDAVSIILIVTCGGTSLLFLILIVLRMRSSIKWGVGNRIQSLRNQGASSAKQLVRYLAHTDVGVRRQAADALVSLGPAVVPDLIAQLSGYQSWVFFQTSAADQFSWRVETVAVLGRIGDARIIPMLETEIRGQDQRMLFTVADILVRFGTQEALSVLSYGIETKVPFVRLAIYRHLAGLGVTAEPALRAAQLDPDAAVREFAQKALV